jgi:hypothetical protein
MINNDKSINKIKQRLKKKYNNIYTYNKNDELILPVYVKNIDDLLEDIAFNNV